MKNYLLTLMVMLVSVSVAFSQTKPLQGDFGIGFRVAGLQNVSLDEWTADDFDIPQAMVRYYLMDRLALRMTIGLQSSNSSSEYSFAYIDSVRFANPLRIDTVTQTTVSQFGLNLTPGAEWHLGVEAPKLDPYVGAEIPISYIGNRVESFDNEYFISDLNGSVVYKEDVNTKTDSDGGLAVGLNLLGGFNYFITDNIAIGAEYRIGVLYTQVGGDIRVSRTGVIQPTGDVNNQVPVDEVVNFKNVNTTLGTGLASSGGVNFSIFW